MSIRDTQRLAEAEIEPSVRSVGDSRDNALAETINELYKAEVIRRRRCKRLPEVEIRNAIRASRVNRPWWPDHEHHSNRGGPAEREAACFRQQITLPMAA